VKDEELHLIKSTRIPVERTSDQDRTITLNDLSKDQRVAFDSVLDTTREKHLVSLGGYAGTGKSTLIPLMAQALGNLANTGFCTLTGKASNVLDRKLRAAGIKDAAHIGTIHSLIYRPITDENGQIIRWIRNRELQTWEGVYINRLFIDEASMVGLEIMEDLKSYGIPIVAVGDPGQLPPIKDESVIEEPDFVLEKIHRQAQNNPIIKLAHAIRTEGDIPRNWKSSDNVRFVKQQDIGPVLNDGFSRLGLNFGILVRRNKMRKEFNTEFRSQPTPEVGDIVICLKNNPPVFNGMRGLLDSIKKLGQHWYHATVRFPDDGLVVQGPLLRKQFGAEYTVESKREVGLKSGENMGLLFDYGSTLTVHKSQGSAFDECAFIPEKWSRDSERDYARWAYTAVTRAANKINIVQ